jgi:hypothetical protein
MRHLQWKVRVCPVVPYQRREKGGSVDCASPLGALGRWRRRHFLVQNSLCGRGYEDSITEEKEATWIGAVMRVPSWKWT